MNYNNKTIERLFNEIPTLKTLNKSIKMAIENLDNEIVIENSRSEDNDNIYIYLSLAGMTKDDIKIEITEYLTVMGNVNIDSKYSSFHKAFIKKYQLNDKINKTDISADMVDGILTITLPKIVEKKPNPIQVIIK